jgi:hypothetical protein
VGSQPLTARTVLGHSTSGGRLDRGGHVHAVEGSSMISIVPALCGTRPGRWSPGWSQPVDDPVTCPRCQREMTRRRA